MASRCQFIYLGEMSVADIVPHLSPCLSQTYFLSIYTTASISQVKTSLILASQRSDLLRGLLATPWGLARPLAIPYRQTGGYLFAYQVESVARLFFTLNFV